MFKVGDTVAFIDEPGGGEIRRIEGSTYYVLTQDGFEEPFQAHELILRRSFAVGEVQAKEPMRHKPPSAERQKYRPNKLEADLHFGALVDFPKNFSAFEKLQIQLREARKTIDKARQGGIKKVILIHGVGQGRLKEEIHSMLERMDRLTFYDASFAEYGAGATEVELF